MLSHQKARRFPLFGDQKTPAHIGTLRSRCRKASPTGTTLAIQATLIKPKSTLWKSGRLKNQKAGPGLYDRNEIQNPP